MNIIIVSSKFPPEYSGSGLRCHNTYLRLKEKYKINYKVLTSSVTENKNLSYKFEGVDIKRISYKPFHSIIFLNSNLGYKYIDYVLKYFGKLMYRLDFLVEFFLTLIYQIGRASCRERV